MKKKTETNATLVLFVDISHAVYQLGKFSSDNKIAPEIFCGMLLQSLAAFLAYNCGRLPARDILLEATNQAVELINRSPEREIFDAAYNKAIDALLKQHNNDPEEVLRSIEEVIKKKNET